MSSEFSRILKVKTMLMNSGIRQKIMYDIWQTLKIINYVLTAKSQKLYNLTAYATHSFNKII